MRFLPPDVNILIALPDTNHPGHQAAQNWLIGQQRQGWATYPLTENDFLRVFAPTTALVVPNRLAAAFLLLHCSFPVRLQSVAYALKANTVPDGAGATAKIADGAIPTAKLAPGVGNSSTGATGGDLTGSDWRSGRSRFIPCFAGRRRFH